MKVTNPHAYLAGWLLGAIFLSVWYVLWALRHRVRALRGLARMERWLNP